MKETNNSSHIPKLRFPEFRGEYIILNPKDWKEEEDT